MAKTRSTGRDSIPALEWVAAAFGLLVVIALIAIIGRGAVASDGDEVPLLTATVERAFPTPAGHVVEVAVANRSSITAASVQIEGNVGGGSADEETSIGSIDYVPGNSSATGGLIFSRNPGAGELTVRVTGYELP